MRAALICCTAIFLTGCGDEQEAATAVPPPPTFTIAEVGQVALYPERSAPAAVIGRNEARLSAEVTAVIRALPADTGVSVARGEVVARLEPRDAELTLERAAAALAQAQARHDQAHVQLERARALRAKNFYSAEALTLRETELAATAADLRAATAQRDSARRALDKHVLRAPFDGVVRTRSGQVGELAVPGTVLLTLVQSGDLEVAAQIQPREAQSLAAAAEVTFVSAVGSRHALENARLSPVLHRESRSIEARLRFRDMPPAVGSEGRLLWRESAAYLPAELLVRRNGRYGVFVAADGKARFHLLTEAQEGRPALLDLPADARIVTQGRHALQDGMPLQ